MVLLIGASFFIFLQTKYYFTTKDIPTSGCASWCANKQLVFVFFIFFGFFMVIAYTIRE